MKKLTTVYVTTAKKPYFKKVEVEYLEGGKSFGDLDLKDKKNISKVGLKKGLEKAITRKNGLVKKEERRNNIKNLEYFCTNKLKDFENVKLMDMFESKFDYKNLKGFSKINNSNIKFVDYIYKDTELLYSKNEREWLFGSFIYNYYKNELEDLNVNVFSDIYSNINKKAINSAKVLCVLKSLSNIGLLDKVMESKVIFEKVMNGMNAEDSLGVDASIEEKIA